MGGGGGPHPGTSVGTDELGAYVRAKKGQKRHSISGGSSLGYPHQVTNPNHALTKAPAANKKKARFELQQQQRPLTVNTSSASYLASLSSSAPPTSSPISIPATSATLSARPSASTVCLPCSRCAVLLPLRSSSVPLSEDPVCERCLDAPSHSFTHKRALTSSSVPVRSSAHLMMTSSTMPASSHLHGWESEDEDYEFVDPPSQPMQPSHVPPHPQPPSSWNKQASHPPSGQHHQFSGAGSHSWSLEEEFSFLDTSFAADSDPMLDSMDDVPPMPTLAGWGGPFFKNMPMPTGRKFAASAVQEASSSPMLGGGSGPGHHRSFTSPESSSSSSTSSLASFSPASAMPSPLTSSFTHDSNGLATPATPASEFNHLSLGSAGGKGLLLGLANMPPSLSRQQSSHASTPTNQAFAAAAQARLPIRPFLNGSLASTMGSASELEFLVGGGSGPLSPIFASSSEMRRPGSSTSAGKGSSLFKWEHEDDSMQIEPEEGLVSV